MESINLFEDRPKWERQGQSIQANEGTTVAFSTKSNSWVSRYSFTPSCYMNTDSELLSNSQTVEAMWGSDPTGQSTAYVPYYGFIFPGYNLHDYFHTNYRRKFTINPVFNSIFYQYPSKRIWRHDVNTEYNTFYDNDTYMSSVEVVANDNPSAVKHFKNLSLESNSSDWVGSVYTNEDRGDDAEQFGDFILFEEKEGNQYAAIPKSTTTGVGNIQLIGKLPLEKVWEGYGAVEGSPFGWSLKARGFMPYELDEEGEAQWQGSFTQIPLWQYDYNDNEVVDYLYNPTETWDIPLFGYPDKPVTGRGIFFGTKMHSTTASGVLHTAVPTDGVEFSGYGAGLHRNVQYTGPAGTRPPNYMTTPFELVGYNYEATVWPSEETEVYSSDGSGEVIGTVSEDPFYLEDIPPNSIRVRLNRDLRQNDQGQSIVNDPIVNMEQYEILKELHDAIIPEVEPWDINSPPPTHYYMPSAEEGDLNAQGEYVPYDGCSERPNVTWVQAIEGPSGEVAPPYFETYLGPQRRCFSPGCDYSDDETNLAGWIGVYTMADPKLNGETMKGPYAGVKLYLREASEPIELFAINVDYEKTKLDGSLG